MPSEWINFKELRDKLNFAEVLKSYGVKLAQKGNTDQFVGPCPLPRHGDKRGQPFSANYKRGLWQCFGCKEGGNVIDFAVLMEGGDKRDGKAARTVAGKLRDKFVTKKAPETTKPDQRPRTIRSEQETAKPRIVNQPLDFALKTLETEHPFFTERRITSETVNHFGLGFCKRGSLTGRIAIPLHDDADQLVGYAGLILDEKQATPANPRYLYPASRETDDARHVFDPTKFVYHGWRVARSTKDLVIVRECHSVWSLWQGGISNVVGLMGNEFSDIQAGSIALMTTVGARVWLLTDSSPESEECASNMLPTMALTRLCSWIRVERDEDIAPSHPLIAALAKR